jgi:hypothetical protein
MEKKVKLVGILGSGLFGAVIIIVGPLIFGLIVTLLWNSVVTPHGIQDISYLEGVGIYILTGLLFRKGNSRLSDFLTGGLKKKEAVTYTDNFGPLKAKEDRSWKDPQT